MKVYVLILEFGDEGYSAPQCVCTTYEKAQEALGKISETFRNDATIFEYELDDLTVETGFQ
jgi:hypothetical protein